MKDWMHKEIEVALAATEAIADPWHIHLKMHLVANLCIAFVTCNDFYPMVGCCNRMAFD